MSLSAIDMSEDRLADFLSQEPCPSMHDLRLLGPYLFNLSNAVKQAAARDLKRATVRLKQAALHEGGDGAQQVLELWAQRVQHDIDNHARHGMRES